MSSAVEEENVRFENAIAAKAEARTEALWSKGQWTLDDCLAGQTQLGEESK